VSKLNIAQLVASLEDVADDLLDSDVHTAMKLHRIASNIALAASDNEQIESSSVGPALDQLPSIVKEAVSETRKERTSRSKKVTGTKRSGTK
jgi:hypothetical protein